MFHQDHSLNSTTNSQNPQMLPSPIMLEISNMPQINYTETILVELVEYKKNTFLIKDKRAYKTLTDTLIRWQDTHSQISEKPYTNWLNLKRMEHNPNLTNAYINSNSNSNNQITTPTTINLEPVKKTNNVQSSINASSIKEVNVQTNDKERLDKQQRKKLKRKNRKERLKKEKEMENKSDSEQELDNQVEEVVPVKNNM